MSPQHLDHAHAHDHSAPLDVSAQQIRRVRIALATMVIPLILATALAMVTIWPHGSSLVGSREFVAPGSSMREATVTAMNIDGCPESVTSLRDVTAGVGTGAVQPDGNGQAPSGQDGAPAQKGVTPQAQGVDPQGADTNGQAGQTEGQAGGQAAQQSALSSAQQPGLLADAVCARIESGPTAGVVMPVHVPPESQQPMRVGDRIEVMENPGAIVSGTPFIFVDFERSTPIFWLLGAYAVLVVLVAGRKGFASMIGLAFAIAIMMFFVIPALLGGQQPISVALVGASAMMIVCLYTAHGITVKTTTALLGTIVGVAIMVGLAVWGTSAARLTGAVDENAYLLSSFVPGINLPALLTCGMVIAGLGVLNDVTITQASSVWELHSANPSLSVLGLIRSGMRIGRDHIASTVYTLAFAYAGGALPLVLSAALIDRSVMDTVLSGQIAEEIVRTLVASIGLVLAIPITTAIAALLSKATAPAHKVSIGKHEQVTVAPVIDGDERASNRRR
ncbi:YibE/F family protein [Actinomyces vulturis]|uniref:YibE/F family protein n=1 Tax=Actinomyces vulturis TaxID=1857645 RepID=UPI00082F71FE|nr:YibE/F family protein [Actinomyces vulturis]